MRGFLAGLLLGLLAIASVQAANVETIVVGTNGVQAVQSADGRTWTVSPQPHTTQSGTAYTLASTDCGTQIVFTNAAAVSVTIPATLAVDCNVTILQAGAGQVAVTGTAVTAATLHSAHAFTKTYGQWAMISVDIYSNVGGSAAIAILTGDGA